MKQAFIKIICIISSFLVIAFNCNIALADTDKGDISDTVSWQYSDGTLYITGYGEIPDYTLCDWYSYCDNITRVIFDDEITSIGANTFSYLTNLQSVSLSSNLLCIGSNAFCGCSALCSVYIPPSVRYIAPDSFGGCLLLESIDVNSRNLYYASQNEILYNKDLSTLVKYPAAHGGESFTVPNTVSRIASGAFCDNRFLKRIELSDSVRYVESLAFSNCAVLSEISVESDLCEFDLNNRLPQNTTIIASPTSKVCEFANKYNYNFESGETTQHIHTYTAYQKVPDCLEGGYTAYICNECGDGYTDNKTQPLGHNEVTDYAKEATCTSYGLTQGSHCSRCGKIIKAQNKIDMKPHTPVVDKAVSPTYSKKGKTKGSHCSKCGKVIAPQKSVDKLTVAKMTLSSAKSKKKAQLTLSWKKNTKVSGYQIQLATNNKFTKNNKTYTIKNNKTTTKTVKKLKSSKKYYVRIRAYKTENGKKYFGKWSNTKSVKIK